MKPIKLICISNQLSQPLEESYASAVEAERQMLALRRTHGKFASITILGRTGHEISGHRLKVMVRNELAEAQGVPAS